MKKRIISTEKAPAAVGTYSQAVAITDGTTIFQGIITTVQIHHQ